MGEQNINASTDDEQLRTFMKKLLDDVVALEALLETDRFETGIRRVGAEQEMFLVDRSVRPASVVMEVLERANDPRLTTELARFNMEANLTPQVFSSSCLRRMEDELNEVLSLARDAARACGADILLTGILPTLRKSDLGLDNMTPKPRYLELNRTLRRLRGDDFHVLIRGVDEFETTHDNVMLESCNTSFQVHFQVGPREFAKFYNLAQAVTGPLLAASVNSPVLLKHRLWQETRIALFERSVDTRSTANRFDRASRPRVHFGDGWIRQGVLEIYREDIARFRILIANTIDEDPMQVIERGGIPQFHALRLHNGTVYRWNRACYGISGDKAHLRIENRVLPSGPTVLDEVANAAFFIGCLAALAEDEKPIEQQMSFEDTRTNFFNAARDGLKCQIAWKGKMWSAQELLLKELIPTARWGLEFVKVDSSDIDRYMGALEERVRKNMTGSQWMLNSLHAMGEQGTADIRYRTLSTAMLNNQKSGAPVHTWELAQLEGEPKTWRDSYQTAGQFMSTDLFTVQPSDIIDLAANIMDWKKIRHILVEDEQGNLCGLLSHRALIRMVARGTRAGAERPTVGQVMVKNPLTIGPEMPTLEVMKLMRERGISCLPVLERNKLVGVITERDLIDVSAKLLESYLRDAQ